MEIVVNWSPEAVEDLDSIANYIAKDSHFYAQSVVNKILAVASSLKNNPLLGRVVPELTIDNIRERFIYSYRLIYKINNSEILIVAIIHDKRLLSNDSRFF